jgi:hypothetical protein
VAAGTAGVAKGEGGKGSPKRVSTNTCVAPWVLATGSTTMLANAEFERWSTMRT